jgi:hypothetical protein
VENCRDELHALRDLTSSERIGRSQNGCTVNITFRRTLTDNRWQLWLQLVQRLMPIQLNNEKDEFIWGLTTNGIFTVKSMYLDLLDDDTIFFK